MEFVQLGDLDNHMRSPFAEAEVQLIIRQVLDGLVHMHGQGYAHRDLKPANLLVFSSAPQWHVKIADFGLSKRLLEQSASHSIGAGTLAYMAPERHGLIDDDSSGEDTEERKDPHPYAVDIWALGVIAFQLLTMSLPFSPFELRALRRYVLGKGDSPLRHLAANEVTVGGQASIQEWLTARPRDRPTAARARQSGWLTNGPRDPAAINAPPKSESEASAQWSVTGSTMLDDSGYQTPAVSTAQVFRPISRDGGSLPSSPANAPATFTCIDPAAPPSGRQGDWPASDREPARRLEKKPSNQPGKQEQVTNGHSYANSVVQQDYTGCPGTLALKTMSHDCQTWPMAISPDGSLLAVVNMAVPKIRLLGRATPAEVKEIRGGSSYCGHLDVAISPDGSLIVLWGIQPRSGESFFLFNVANGEELAWTSRRNSEWRYRKEWSDRDCWVRGMAISPDGQLIALQASARVNIHHMVTGAPAKELTPAAPAGMLDYSASTFSPDGRIFAVAYYVTACRNNPPKTAREANAYGVQLWNTRTWTALGSLELDRPMRIVDVVFSPNGKLVACMCKPVPSDDHDYFPCEREIHIFETIDRRPLQRLEAGPCTGEQLVFSPDNSVLTCCQPYCSWPGLRVVADVRAGGRCWQTKSWNEIVVCQAEHAILSPNGELLAGFTLGQPGSNAKDVLVVQVWDIISAKEVGRHCQRWNLKHKMGLPERTSLANTDFCAAVSPDSRLLTFSYTGGKGDPRTLVHIIDWNATRVH
nr:hypothetical protein B0A51_08782 [Rachicladosporium sp. CCFEE 5018]